MYTDRIRRSSYRVCVNMTTARTKCIGRMGLRKLLLSATDNSGIIRPLGSKKLVEYATSNFAAPDE